MHRAEIIAFLKARRAALGITQEHLAELAAVSPRSLKSIEGGKGNPTLSTLEKLADVLGLEIRLAIKQPAAA